MKNRIAWFHCLTIFVTLSFISIMAQPQPVAEFVDPDNTGINFRSVEEKDGYVYACRRDGTLFVYDTRTSLFLFDGSPGESDQFLTFDAPIQTIKFEGSTINSLVRYKNLLYGLGSAGIEIIDLADPSAPALLTEDRVFTNAGLNIILFNDYLFTCGGGLLEAYQLNDPKKPTKVAGYSPQDTFPWSIAGYRDIIYVAESAASGTEEHYLQILDFSDRTSFEELKRITYEEKNGVSYQLRVVGDILIESASSNLRIRDLGKSGLNPVVLDEVLSSGRACATAGNYVFTNSRVFRIANSTIEEIASYTAGQVQHDGTPHGSVIRHDIGFIAQEHRVLAVRYVSPPVLVFPQLAWGGGVITEVFLSNPGNSIVTGKLLFKSNNGEPVSISVGGESRYSLSFDLQPGATFKAKTDSSGNLQVGYAVVVADPYASEINGTIGYNLNGNEVSVPNSILSDQYHVVVERNGAANSGIAIANPGLVTSSVFATLIDVSGSLYSQGTIILEPGEKISRFINEIFLSVPETFMGSFHIHSDSGVALSGFRQLTTGSLLSLSGSPTAFESPE